jgi:glutathione S-transferase
MRITCSGGTSRTPRWCLPPDNLVRRYGADDPVSRSLAGRHDKAYDMVDARLGEAVFFAGDTFTVADIAMLFPLTTMRAFSKRPLDGYPKLQAYLQRIGARPGYQSAMTKSDPGAVSDLTVVSAARNLSRGRL